MDKMIVTILEDGSVRVETSKIGALNHMSAEAVLRALALAGGGVQTRKHKLGVIGAVVHAGQHLLGGHHH
jgi:hypothetical protein